MKACFSGHLNVTQYLIEKGADIHITNSVSARSILSPFPPNKTYLQQTHGSTALFYAAMSGEVLVVQYLVDNGAEINAINKEGDTPLMKAADFGNVAVVHYLVEKGADVLAQNIVSNSLIVSIVQ